MNMTCSSLQSIVLALAFAWRIWLATLACLIPVAVANPATPFALVVLSDESPAYQEVLQGLRDQVREAGLPQHSVVAIPWKDYASHARAPTMIVAVGVRAMQSVLATPPGVPVACALVPRRTFDLIKARLGSTEDTALLTAVYLDQPLSRQLELLRAVLPATQRVGVVAGAESAALLPELRSLARERRLTLNSEILDGPDQLAGALQHVVSQSQVLLMLPDSAVSNANSVRDLLLVAHRNQRPVIGFSQAYVRAGALAAVFSSPAQIGREVGTVMLKTLNEPGKLPAARYPVEFDVSLNFHVARAYGLQLDTEASVRQKLRTLEARP